MQTSPEAAVKELLDEGPTECTPRSARESSLAHWEKADAYYFCNIARVQRIWQVSIACWHGSDPALCDPPDWSLLVVAVLRVWQSYFGLQQSDNTTTGTCFCDFI